MGDVCIIKDCGKNASYGISYMKGIYCRQHGIENSAKPKQKICVCGSSVPSYGFEEDERPSCCAKCKTSAMKNTRAIKCKECTTRASYGIKGEKAEYCATHKKVGMVDLMNKLCSDCDKIATFGTDLKKPTACETHKTPEMTSQSHKLCETPHCKKTASCGIEWQKPLMCAKHATEGMKNVVTKRCEFEGCGKIASFGNDGKKTHCKEHKMEDMESAHKKCESEGCKVRAGYGYEKTEPTYCATHKKEDMLNLLAIFCAHEGCKVARPSFRTKTSQVYFCKDHKNAFMTDKRHTHCQICPTRANFGPKGGKPSFCSKHKKEGMIDLVNRRCEHIECDRITPTFGFKGEKGRFCSTHKLEGMVDVRHKLCEAPGCEIQATYALKEATKPTHCLKHRLATMAPVNKKTCKHPGCEIIPSFGLPGKKAEFCVSHKLPSMILLASRPCAMEGCVTNASYNVKGAKPLFCAKHKEKGMINVYGVFCAQSDYKKTPSFGFRGGEAQFCAEHKSADMLDVKHALCVCGTRAHYGKPGTPLTHCMKHREPGMIRRSGSKCKKCSAPAIFGHHYQNLHCEAHKTEGEQNYVEQICAGCGLTMVLDGDAKCEYCAPGKFRAGLLAKQNALMAFLDKQGLAGTTTDKLIDGGICGKERPDRIFDAGSFVVILECDEHQHNDRTCECEQTRMVNIAHSFGGIPVYFIRFNPDNYSPAEDSAGVQPIQKRHKLVADLLSDLVEGRVHPPDALCSAIYLYFDDWSSLEEETWKVIMPFENRISHV